MNDDADVDERRLAGLFGELRAPASMRRWEAAVDGGRGERRTRWRWSPLRLVAVGGELRLRPVAAAIVVPLVLATLAGGLGLRAHFAGGQGSSGGGPSPRTEAAMAWDAAHHVVVLFGGRNGRIADGDTWTWDGQSWTQQHPAVSPPARSAALMAFDPRSGRVLLFGGTLSSGGRAAADTWSWDGSTWRQEHPAHQPGGQPGFLQGGMATDGARGEVVLVGFDVDSLASGPLAATPVPAPSTVSPSPAGPTGPGIGQPAGVQGAGTGGFDSVTDSVSFSTWAWTGDDWQKRSPATSPTGALGPVALAYDGRSRTVLAVTSAPVGRPTCHVGPREGSGPQHAPAPVPTMRMCTVVTPQSTTWSWDGSTWRRAGHPRLLPIPLKLATDPTGTVLALGGSASWTWTGSEWESRSDSRRPTPRVGAAIASDAGNGTVVLFGGHEGAAYGGDTWTWDGSSWTVRAGATLQAPSATPSPTPTAPPSAP